jgi:hypothetical protein
MSLGASSQPLSPTAARMAASAALSAAEVGICEFGTLDIGSPEAVRQL